MTRKLTITERVKHTVINHPGRTATEISRAMRMHHKLSSISSILHRLYLAGIIYRIRIYDGPWAYYNIGA